jgi:hypothetical protein
MQELVTVEQAHRVIVVLAWALPLAGLLLGAVVGAVRGGPGRGAWQGLAVGLLGPIIYAMWLLYSHMVRYDPETGRAGLHSVATLVFNALIFAVVGAMLGAFYRRVVFRPSEQRSDTPPAEDAPQ